MAKETNRESAYDPQDLEQLLVARQWEGDLEGMVALYETDAVLDCDDGLQVRGRDAIRAYFSQAIARNRKFQAGEQRPALVSGDLALTSTHLPDGSITSEVARRQDDGTWLWVIDRFSVT